MGNRQIAQAAETIPSVARGARANRGEHHDGPVVDRVSVSNLLRAGIITYIVASLSSFVIRQSTLDIAKYLQRIHYHGSLQPNAETLCALHRAHLLAVPFENLNIPMGWPIVLDEAALYRKIVERRRGGFCYELNGLFAALLRALGFDVQRLAARVTRADGGWGIEFDHMTLRVQLAEPWLVDVGFGDSFTEPLRLAAQGEQPQNGDTYRIVAAGAEHILQRREDDEWKSQYLFSLRPHPLADFMSGCHYHQTSPESPFTRRRVCTRATPDGRITLSDMKLIVTRGSQREEHLLASDVEYHTALREYFNIDLSVPPV